MTDPILSVQDLRIGFGADSGDVVRGVSFDISPGECFALVGESGSGKSVTARSLLGLTGDGARVDATTLELRGRSMLHAGQREWRRVRGRDVGLVLQDALGSLDPLRPIGREIDDALRLHTALSPARRRTRMLELLASVGMPEPEVRSRQRSGQLSGGLRQRALIASAIATDPPLLIADEPTTALDVTVQAQILDLLADLKAQGTALLLISHDLAVVSRIADRVAVMQLGEIVESGPVDEVLRSGQHPYTRRLLRSVPSGATHGIRLSTEAPATEFAQAFARIPDASPELDLPLSSPVLSATGLRKQFDQAGAATPLVAVDDVSFALRPGLTLGLVGESGSGKSTVARLALGLTAPDAGEVLLQGEPWSAAPEKERRARRSLIGAIYQDPLSSFDPRLTVRDILLDAVGAGRRSTADLSRVAELLDAVGLSSAVADRRPLHLSGGQRQRVSIARAIAPAPRVLICDEPVSALDVSVQAQVLDLLVDLQRELGTAYLFISHDIGVVRHVSHDVAVMRGGRIVEAGTPDQIFGDPRHEYTQQLLAAVPQL